MTLKKKNIGCVKGKKKKNDTPTMGIKHRADSAFRKFPSLSKLGFGRTVMCFEVPYVSYPRPLCAI